ncbi:MAG: hypothetical protein LC725_08660 [Lentisphaerae bacterium]|nr:hypothetical protein [Lentisphaerota bacterium]
MKLLPMTAVVICVVALLGFSATAAAKSFDLQVNDVSGLDEPWPLIGGLPFPEGELHDASLIRVVDGEGQEVPSQIDVAATWRDGSIRWALAGLTASPQGEYRVEYGPDVSRASPARPLTVKQAANGAITVDTGAAVYEFLSDRLLPETARMGDTVILAGSGDGAYLVDNQGRLARVAGEMADIKTEILKQGPVRAVIRRAGWYVTDDGARVARAKVWFYFAAGTPYLKVTHSLVFTEDTNKLWVRDYGLEFRTPEEPRQVVFAHRAADETEKMEALTGKSSWDAVSEEQRQALVDMFSGVKERDWQSFLVAPEGGEVYLLQDIYPHFLERDFRAVIGKVDSVGGLRGRSKEDASFWLEPWEKTVEVVGDWGDAQFRDFVLTVVMPWLAQQFPKEIAFGPGGARVAFWSGRSGRELDFRALTLIEEYWQEWAAGDWRGSPRAPGGPTALAAKPSNAQGAARTHDVWLLPRRPRDNAQAMSARTKAASNPPLLQADPVWLAGTSAIGWPVHPRDPERFADQEAVIEDYWDSLRGAYVQLRHTGFIEWGKNHTLRHAKSEFFRVTRLIDYGLRRHVWSLYGRSGQRSYWEYGSRFNRFAGDWELAHWTAGTKIRGMFSGGDNMLPLHWGEHSSREHHAGSGPTGHTIAQWLLDYYMTGDEYPLHLTDMVGEAYLNDWDRDENVYTQSLNELQILALLYSRGWNEHFRELAQYRARNKIDLDNPIGITDDLHHGPIYKMGRDLLSLYDYYMFTGDTAAREAFLKGVDYKYRFNLIRAPFGGQNYVGFIFSIAYKWTGNINYLRVVNAQLENGKSIENPPGRITSNQHPTLSIPTALTVMAKVNEPIDPFPVLSYSQKEGARTMRFVKAAGSSVEIGCFLRMDQKDRVPECQVRLDGEPGALFPEQVELYKEFAFQPASGSRANPRDWHIRVVVSADLPAGNYLLEIPHAESVVVLDSSAPEITIGEK